MTRSKVTLLALSLFSISRLYTEWCRKERTSCEISLFRLKQLVDQRDQRWMSGPVRNDRNSAVTKCSLFTAMLSREASQNAKPHTPSHTLRWRMYYNSRLGFQQRTGSLRIQSLQKLNAEIITHVNINWNSYSLHCWHIISWLKIKLNVNDQHMQYTTYTDTKWKCG